MATSVWGDKETHFFYTLGPEGVLNAVETSGLECTGRCLALNSMENRVYEVEIVVTDTKLLRSPSERFRIAKFYRPGRWSREQILEEHEFLIDLNENEIPVIAPLQFEDGTTLRQFADGAIWYALFPKMGGRAPEDMDRQQLERMGRLLARMHNVGAAKAAQHRLHLTPTTYGRNNLAYLLENDCLPLEIKKPYETTVETICQLGDTLFASTATQRIHGDCHLGNILWGSNGPLLLDFDDMVIGPCVQDIWMVVPGRDDEAVSNRQILVDAYEEMRNFDRRSLKLIEVLRALRFIHFSAWIAKRWQDPAFPRTFPHFSEKDYWSKQLVDLNEQLQLIKKA